MAVVYLEQPVFCINDFAVVHNSSCSIESLVQ